jgi:hypothetical protein
MLPKVPIASVGTLVLALAAPVVVCAHHSYAMYDYQTEVTLEGTVKRFQWMNPHVFIDVESTAQASVGVWSIELSSPSHLVRNGWKPTSLKEGELIRVVIHPLRDGRHGGTYVAATRADGRPLVQAPRSSGAQP